VPCQVLDRLLALVELVAAEAVLGGGVLGDPDLEQLALALDLALLELAVAVLDQLLSRSVWTFESQSTR
jgi:hypothetical protein